MPLVPPRMASSQNGCSVPSMLKPPNGLVHCSEIRLLMAFFYEVSMVPGLSRVQTLLGDPGRSKRTLPYMGSVRDKSFKQKRE